MKNKQKIVGKAGRRGTPWIFKDKDGEYEIGLTYTNGQSYFTGLINDGGGVRLGTTHEQVWIPADAIPMLLRALKEITRENAKK